MGLRNIRLPALLTFIFLTGAAFPADPPLRFDTALFTKNDVEVKSRLTGIIEQIFVDRGSWVKKGDPLARLQNEDFALEVKKAEVSMEETKAEYQRAKSLFDQKLLSESEYDLKRLSNERAETQHQIAKVEFEKSIIKAPFPGVVAELSAKIGQRVVEDENTPLFRITALEPLLARILITEEQLPQVTSGMKADFVPNVATGKSFAGRVKWISSTIDAASGTAQAIVELDPGQGKGLLRPGTSGKVILRTKPGQGTAATSP